uniref:Uncharacterized protein n=1 Tax=Lepeophtheirus salmonis TaxID=72036 RepID=A0A0K2UF25_LEPSM
MRILYITVYLPFDHSLDPKVKRLGSGPD